jgi:uncharacterized protein (DUF983 family)
VWQYAAPEGQLMPSQSVRKALTAALKLCCPRCGERTLFRGAFAMNDECAQCHLVFEREPGYFVGAIYINYAVTAVVTIGGFLILDAYTAVPMAAQLAMWSLFGIAFPLFFFRYSKSLWLAFDQFINPEEPELRVVRGRHP